MYYAPFRHDQFLMSEIPLKRRFLMSEVPLQSTYLGLVGRRGNVFVEVIPLRYIRFLMSEVTL